MLLGLYSFLVLVNEALKRMNNFARSARDVFSGVARNFLTGGPSGMFDDHKTGAYNRTL